MSLTFEGSPLDYVDSEQVASIGDYELHVLLEAEESSGETVAF